MTDTGPPTPEVPLDVALVRALLADQHPDLADRPLVEASAGWDNTMFRLGDDLAVRLPRRALAAPLIDYEQRWLPELAPTLPVPIPVPLRLGRPALGYPWRWSVVPWFEGRPIIDGPLADPIAVATDVGRFLAALHRPAPATAPPNPYRGIPVTERAAQLRREVQALGGAVDGRTIVATWDRLADAPAWSGPDQWLHGDLHAANLLVHRGRLSAVIDFGDLTAGDPATDLAVGWLAFGPEARPALRAAYGAVDDAMWDRARAWSIALAVAYLSSPLSTPPFLRIGHEVLDAIAEDD